MWLINFLFIFLGIFLLKYLLLVFIWNIGIFSFFVEIVFKVEFVLFKISIVLGFFFSIILYE